MVVSSLLLLLLFWTAKDRNPFAMSRVELAQLAQKQAEQQQDDMVFRFVDAPADQTEVEDARFLSDADRIEKSQQTDAPNQNNDPLSQGNTYELKNRNNQPEAASPQSQPSPPVNQPPSPQLSQREPTPKPQESDRQAQDNASQAEEMDEALQETPEEVTASEDGSNAQPSEAGAGDAPLFEGGPKPYRKLSEAQKQELAAKAQQEMKAVSLSETMGNSSDSGTYHNPDGRNAPTLGLSVETNRSDMGEYLKILRQLIKGNWRIPAIARFEVAGVTGVAFNIHKDGRITDVELIKGSGYDPLDVSATNAITTTYQAPPLPDHVDEDPVPMKFAFYYNMRPRY